MRYTLNFWSDDMGTFKQPGCRDVEDALWHINSARDHDGLKPLQADDLLMALSQPRNTSLRATLTPEN